MQLRTRSRTSSQHSDSAGHHEIFRADCRSQTGSRGQSNSISIAGRASISLRVQTDNLNQPLNINQNTRLEPGSTPSFGPLLTLWKSRRCCINNTPIRALHLSAWAIQYLSNAQDRGESAMPQAAVEWKYWAIRARRSTPAAARMCSQILRSPKTIKISP